MQYRAQAPSNAGHLNRTVVGGPYLYIGEPYK
jgi:hypothetical protein